MFFRDFSHITSLAIADLRFEWILSACMVLALGAVFAPLFILLGLREGIVGSMLDKLQRDPASRLVMPKFPVAKPLDDAWLRALAEQSHTVIGSSTSRLLLDVEGIDKRVNVVPTTAEDPLLTENDIALPQKERSLVISDPLAKAARKQAGNELTLTLVRTVRVEERVPIKFRIAGVLPAQSSDDTKIWLPLNLFQWFDRWREGHAVSGLGLAGSGSGLTPEFDGILTLLEAPPADADYRRMLAGRMGFSRLPRSVENLGWKIPPDRHVRLWQAVNNRVFESDFGPLVNRHHEHGYAIEVVPYLESFAVELEASEQETRTLVLTVLPSASDQDDDEGRVHESKPVARISSADDFDSGEAFEISFRSPAGRKIGIPVALEASAAVEPGYLALPKDLAGKMNAARYREAIYDPRTGEFSPVGEGVHFFRAYAKSIDELEPLVEFVQKEGLRTGKRALGEPVSRIGEVRYIRQLADSMEKLYFLIALVSGVSGFFAIAANVYAGVQRKRRDLAYLQLLGVYQDSLLLFPMLKSLFLVAGGVVAALVAYLVFGYSASWAFADILTDSSSLTRLTVQNVLVLVTAILGTAAFASLLAASAVVNIDPGEYIRE